LRNGRAPVTARRTAPHSTTPPASSAPPVRDVARDTALNSCIDGRAFVAWVTARTVKQSDWEPFVEVVPLSRLYEVAEMARAQASCWVEFAEALEAKARCR
jgi:hypothetical protein